MHESDVNYDMDESINKPLINYSMLMLGMSVYYKD